MKKIVFAVLLVVTVIAGAQAQCDKKIILTSKKTEFINAKGEVQRVSEEFATVEYDDKQFSVIQGGRLAVSGDIKSISCQWQTPFIKGKTIIKAVVSEPEGEKYNGTITIEGDDKKISFLLEIDTDSSKKVRMIADKFEEKK